MQELLHSRLTPAFRQTPRASFGQGALAAWLTDPPGAVVQFQDRAKGTLAMATWLVESAFDVLDARYPGRNDLLLVLDLQGMVGRSAAARSVLLHGARTLGQRFARVFVVPPAEYPPMYLHAFQASIAIARSLGIRVELADSSAMVIDRLRLRAVE